MKIKRTTIWNGFREGNSARYESIPWIRNRDKSSCFYRMQLLCSPLSLPPTILFGSANPTYTTWMWYFSSDQFSHNSLIDFNSKLGAQHTHISPAHTHILMKHLLHFPNKSFQFYYHFLWCVSFLFLFFVCGLSSYFFLFGVAKYSHICNWIRHDCVTRRRGRGVQLKYDYHDSKDISFVVSESVILR